MYPPLFVVVVVDDALPPVDADPVRAPDRFITVFFARRVGNVLRFDQRLAS